jgi:hypothetical protein
MTLGQHPSIDPNNIQKVKALQRAYQIEQLFTELTADMNRVQPVQSE